MVLVSASRIIFSLLYVQCHVNNMYDRSNSFTLLYLDTQYLNLIHYVLFFMFLFFPSSTEESVSPNNLKVYLPFKSHIPFICVHNIAYFALLGDHMTPLDDGETLSLTEGRMVMP